MRPRVVALGGGHGLAASLQAARHYAGQVTAIVSVADDGGSSGRLREAFGIPAPGDLRRCLVALADQTTPLARAFEYRFEAGELEGHALGNLVIAGLAAAMADFPAALVEAGRLLGLDHQGRVLPATTGPVDLKAQVGDGEVLGQVHVKNTDQPITAVSLVPPDAAPPEEAVEAIRAADQVVIGPGSLYTSVLAVLAVPALRDAVAARRDGRVYVCNLRPQFPETAGFDAAAHVEALRAHGVVPERSSTTRQPCPPAILTWRWSKPPWPGPMAWPTIPSAWPASWPASSRSGRRGSRLAATGPDRLTWTRARRTQK